LNGNRACNSLGQQMRSEAPLAGAIS